MLLLNGDCIEEMQKLIDDGKQVDSVVTDPPYHLTSIVERFGKEGSAPAQEGTDGAFKRASTGFMGKEWDGGDIAFRKETWELAYKLLKPGGHLLAFSASRNYHRMAVAIEDAGFEIRDQIMWIYGSGFPKSLNIGKQIDKRRGNNDTIRVWLKSLGSREELAKAAQVTPRQIDHFIGENTPCPQTLTYERFILICDYFKNYPDWSDSMFPKTGKKVGEKKHSRSGGDDYAKIVGSKSNQKIEDMNELATDKAKQWEGWGTALKPAHEPIVMARKPLSESSIVGNVLKHGTGGINIDASRVQYADENDRSGWHKTGGGGKGYQDTSTFKIRKITPEEIQERTKDGRFPANVIHGGLETEWARYFYCPKTSKSERNVGLDNFTAKPMAWGNQAKAELKRGNLDFKGNQGDGSKHNKVEMRLNTHPTVKPVELMKYLCRLVTPKGGVVLDPFMGSGSTGMAAKDEGFDFIGIEKDEEYFKICESRIVRFAPLMDFM